MSPEIRSVGQRFVVHFQDHVVHAHYLGNRLPYFAIDTKLCEVYYLSFILRDNNISKVNFKRRAYHSI